VILEHYRVKHGTVYASLKCGLTKTSTTAELKQSRTIFYKPYAPLEKPSQQHEHPRTALISTIETLIENKNWYNARELSAELITTALNGLHYLQTYERLLIRAIVTAAYLGWAAYASLFLFRPLDYITAPLKPSWSASIVSATAFITLVTFWVLFAIQRSPWSFYVYIAFPCYFWQQFMQQAIPAFQNRLRTRPINYLRVATRVGVTIAVLQGMVVCIHPSSLFCRSNTSQAAYTYRFIWSIGFVLIGFVWPFTWSKGTLRKYIPLSVTWPILSLVTGIFPLLSVEKQESLSTM
jgi:GPI ethanolamine phosphate transferase 1